MEKYKNVWFINFQGIGNGIIIAPILRCFEESFPLNSYYHIDNQILSDSNFKKIAKLRNIKGFSPSVWRRFNQDNWKDILEFITKNTINLIINIRNEGPKYDTNYYRFKNWIAKNNVQVNFWDLDFLNIESRKIQKTLIEDIMEMLGKNGVNFSKYDQQWLSSLRNLRKEKKMVIGLGTASSQNNKRWSSQKWKQLAELLLNNSYKIKLFPGISPQKTNDILQLSNDSCKTIINESLIEIAKELGDLGCFVSNDTGLLHIAVALGIPTIGIYTSTDPLVWGYFNYKNFQAFTNRSMFLCDKRKIHCGNCFHYYDSCPALMHEDTIKPLDVFKAIQIHAYPQTILFN